MPSELKYYPDKTPRGHEGDAISRQSSGEALSFFFATVGLGRVEWTHVQQL
jgi:hypothetical protein